MKIAIPMNLTITHEYSKRRRRRWCTYCVVSRSRQTEGRDGALQVRYGIGGVLGGVETLEENRRKWSSGCVAQSSGGFN